ncbi:MAG: glycosyltransferase family 2 protein [Actinobacteria bacterium]|nr:glycosyltransferase family 2 protein [Actinomycetota bacterium]
MNINTFIAVVTYNSEDFIENCMSSIVNSDFKKWFLAVIDNCSGDSTAERIAELKAAKSVSSAVLDENNFGFIGLKKNIGFASAVNWLVFDFLLKENAGLARGIKYLVLLNPDVILETTALGKLVLSFEPDEHGSLSGACYKNAGVIGALIHDYMQQGSIQNAGGKIRENYLTYHLQKPPGDKAFYPVDYVSGSVFATRLDHFIKLSGFDSGYRPLYYEELDYCLKLKKTGFLSCINADASAMHYEGASVKKFSRNFYRHYHKNRIRCMIINSSIRYFFSKFLPAEAQWLKNTASKDQYSAVLAAYFLNFLFLSYNLLVKLKNLIITANFSRQRL